MLTLKEMVSIVLTVPSDLSLVPRVSSRFHYEKGLKVPHVGETVPKFLTNP